MLRPLIFRNSFRNIQKTKNVLRPLIFGNSFRNIQKIKNVLRPLIFGNFSKIFRKSKMGYAPHHRPIGQSLPPRGSHEVADNFC